MTLTTAQLNSSECSNNGSPINILWVIDHVCYDGSLHGGGRLFWNVAPRLDPSRFRIFPCMLRGSAVIREVFANSPMPVRILDKGKFDLTTLFTLCRLIRQENIQLLHLHCYGASAFGRLAGLLTGVPAIIHDYDTEIYFPYPWYLKIADRLLSPATAMAIAASPMVRQFLINKRNLAAGRVRMMFHAVPAEKYELVSRDRALAIRRQLGVGVETRMVGTITKLGPQRGNEYLLHAAAAALKRAPDLLFVILYKPTYFHRLPSEKYVPVSAVDIQGEAMDLARLAHSLGISKQLRFIELPVNVDEWLSACDLIVTPFLSDRFSSVNLLEAMAQGKPVIATDLGELREIVDDGREGYLVAPGNVADLSQAILKLLAAPVDLERMGRSARQKSEAYSVDAYARSLERLYEELVSNPADGRVGLLQEKSA